MKIYAKPAKAKKGEVKLRMLKSEDVQGMFRFKGDLLSTTPRFAELLISDGRCEKIEG